MFAVRNKENRGITETSWLKSHHSFSFGQYYDLAQMGFGSLRVINEDWVIPGAGFDTHGHKNMEIITYVLEGVLAHKDSTGSIGEIRPGEVQVMSAGKGILHSEYNASPTDSVHLLQIWIMPEDMNTPPGYRQKLFPPEELHNTFRLLASSDGAEGSLRIRQDARFFAARMDSGQTLPVATRKNRQYWLQVARGNLDFQAQSLDAGDGLAIQGEEGGFSITARTDAEALWFDLPQ